jgi:hypothetical protein
MNIIFDLTNSFKDAYGVKIKKTQIQKVLESRIVAGTENLSNQLIRELKQFEHLSDNS